MVILLDFVNFEVSVGRIHRTPHWKSKLKALFSWEKIGISIIHVQHVYLSLDMGMGLVDKLSAFLYGVDNENHINDEAHNRTRYRSELPLAFDRYSWIDSV